MGHVVMEEDNASRPNFYGKGRICVRPRGLVQRGEMTRLCARLHSVKLPQRRAMCFWTHPQTTVFPVGIVYRNPDARYGAWAGLEITRVLMPSDFATNLRVFKNVHGLPQKWGRITQVPQDGGKERVLTKLAEGGNPIVDRMPNLVDRLRF